MGKQPQSAAEKADKKFSHVPSKGSWEIPRKTFHYSIGIVTYTCICPTTNTAFIQASSFYI